MPWAIATSSRPDEAAGLGGVAGPGATPLVIDGSDVEHAKPAPDLLLKAAHQLDVAPAAAWYVGDSRWDMLAAVAAGMTAIGVATGATSEADLVAAGAAVTFADLARFLDYLSARSCPQPVPRATSAPAEPVPIPDQLARRVDTSTPRRLAATGAFDVGVLTAAAVRRPEPQAATEKVPCMRA